MKALKTRHSHKPRVLSRGDRIDPKVETLKSFKSKLNEWKETGHIERKVDKTERPKRAVNQKSIDRLANPNTMERMRVRELREEKENQELQECSFSPDLSLTLHKRKKSSLSRSQIHETLEASFGPVDQ